MSRTRIEGGLGIVKDWNLFYNEVFNYPLPNYANLVVPEKRDGFDRLVVVDTRLTAERLYEKCAELFPCRKFTDLSLDEAVSTNDRDPKNGSYAIWVREGVESDKELKNKSANDLEAVGTSCITLLEGLLFELKYFRETGRHLGITICAGSRCPNGGVPCFGWMGGRFKVSFVDPDVRYDDWGSREVVS